MFKFPTEPKRRLQWTVNVRRDKWTPTKASCVCSAHFEDHFFEQNRADGWKKLKPNAVPTLFSFRASPKPRKPPKKRTRPLQSVACQGALPTHDEASTTDASSLASGETSGSLTSSTGMPPEQVCIPSASSPSNTLEDNLSYAEGSSPAPPCIDVRRSQSAHSSCAELNKQLADVTRKYGQLQLQNCKVVCCTILRIYM